MNQYEAKFKREAKTNPLDWIIIPNGIGGFALQYIGKPENKE